MVRILIIVCCPVNQGDEQHQAIIISIECRKVVALCKPDFFDNMDGITTDQ
jgi:hypothetical protein